MYSAFLLISLSLSIYACRHSGHELTAINESSVVLSPSDVSVDPGDLDEVGTSTCTMRHVHTSCEYFDYYSYTECVFPEGREEMEKGKCVTIFISYNHCILSLSLFPPQRRTASLDSPPPKKIRSNVC